jgi:hypothetical protein
VKKYRLALLGMVVAATVFVTATPALASTASPASDPAPAVTSEAPSAASTDAVLSTTRTIHPRVKCGSFDGTVTWDHQDVAISGTLREFCGGRTWVHISWNDPVHWDITVDTWVSRGAAHVSANEGTMLSPSNIAVYVCNITKGVRHCGTPIHV